MVNFSTKNCCGVIYSVIKKGRAQAVKQRTFYFLKSYKDYNGHCKVSSSVLPEGRDLFSTLIKTDHVSKERRKEKQNSSDRKDVKALVNLASDG